MTHTWQECADEFGRLNRQGKDVRLALLVACSVVKGRGGPRTVTNVTVGKVSAREFGEQAGVTAPRVLRHLDAWDEFAEAQGLPLADDLTPADAFDPDLVNEAQAEAFGKVRITKKAPPNKVTPLPVRDPARETVSTTEGIVRASSVAARGTPKVTWRISIAEKQRLGDAAEDLYVNGGYSISEIQRAAGVPSNATIRKLLNDRGVATNRNQARKEDPPPIEWHATPVTYDSAPMRARAEEQQKIIPKNHRDDIRVMSWRGNKGASEQSNDLNRIAYIVRNAIAAGDMEWVAEVRADLAWVHQRVGNLVRIIDDPDYREFCLSDQTVRDDWQRIFGAEG